jgi:hypothetical protein
MSEPENFIVRWSRRKHAAAERIDEKTLGEKTSGEKTPEARKAPVTSEAADERTPSSELPFDIAKLPPLESITGESDIRAFLAPGVPVELSRAALRRVWAADPKIRDFVGLADYDWDFNMPGAIPGFGPLEMTDELRRQVAQMVGRSLAPEPSERPAPTSSAPSGEQVSVEASDSSIESSVTTTAAPIQQVQSNTGMSQDKPPISDVEIYNFVQREEDNTATQYRTAKPDNDQLIAKRPHGRALPK